MKHVTIARAGYNFDTDTPYDEPVAVFTVDADGIHVQSGEEFIPKTMPVYDVQARRDVTLEDDPERWAELLPSAYRAGDYFVVVAERPQDEQRIVASDPAAAGRALAEAIDVRQMV
jgi:hypothetical protein